MMNLERGGSDTSENYIFVVFISFSFMYRGEFGERNFLLKPLFPLKIYFQRRISPYPFKIGFTGMELNPHIPLYMSSQERNLLL